MADRCKYCGAVIGSDGFCSRPCKKGESEKRIAEDKEAVANEKREQLEA